MVLESNLTAVAATFSSAAWFVWMSRKVTLHE